MTEAGRRLEATATGQRGYATRRQATAGGFTRAMLRHRIQSGDLHRNGPHTLRRPWLPPDPLGELAGLMLDVGDPVWAFGATAAALHGFDGFTLAPPYHLLITRDRNVRRMGHVIHSTTQLELIDRAVVAGLAVTSPTRTIIDLVRHESRPRVTAALDSALRDGATSEDFLHRRINVLRSRGRYGIPALVEIIEGAEITRGGHSWLERRFLEIVQAAGLPRPAMQVEMSRAGDRLIRVDAYFPQQRVVVEVLGYRWHRSRMQMQRDTERTNRLMLDGSVVLQFTYEDVAVHPEVLVATIREALRRAISPAMTGSA